MLGLLMILFLSNTSDIATDAVCPNIQIPIPSYQYSGCVILLCCGHNVTTDDTNTDDIKISIPINPVLFETFIDSEGSFSDTFADLFLQHVFLSFVTLLEHSRINMLQFSEGLELVI